MLEKILDKYPPQKDYLLEILLDVQNSKNDQFLSEEEIHTIASHLKLPEAQVSSAVTFYTFFSTQPRGEYVIQVCKDIPCYINSSQSIVDTIKRELGISMGETTKDGYFTVEHTSCLGICDGAPAVRIGNKTHTNLTDNKMTALLAEYRGRQ